MLRLSCAIEQNAGRNGGPHAQKAMTHESRRAELNHAIRFAGKVLLVLAGIIAAFWILGRAFTFSRWAGYLHIGLFMIPIYVTAHRWVAGLPALLIFGVFSSFVALTSGHAPTNPQKPFSVGLACLLLGYQAMGCIAYRYYDEAHFSVVDRIALLIYLFCLFWPGFTLGANLGVVTPVIAWSMTIGMAALGVSFAIHHKRRGKKLFGA